nr:MAG TPA: hypothetical protein [Caudoviricetes sp.]
MKIIYLSKKLGKEILKDMEFVMNSNSWNEVDGIYDKWSEMFRRKMAPLFGEDGAVSLEHDIFDYDFKTSTKESTIERFKTAVEEQWPKYTVVGGFAHWVYIRMTELESF